MTALHSRLKELLEKAIRQKATDIHFAPNEQDVQLFFRSKGIRFRDQSLSHVEYEAMLNYLKFKAGMDIGETRKPQDGMYRFNLNEIAIDLRLSTLPIKQLESLAIRLLPYQTLKPLSELLLFNHQVKQLKSMINSSSGIILLTGPTGSGKTTLLYSLLETLLREESYQTITLEDPIEKDIGEFLQVQINEKSGMTYHTGLKAALRHDPDILMVGEIRDSETAAFVFHAAYTGHLVFSTLHAKDATGTINRLLEMGIKPIDLSQNLISICAVQLLPLSIMDRRASIIEILSDKELSHYIKDVSYRPVFQSFHHLRKKAFAYGFTNEC